MSINELKMVKHGIKQKHIRETTWLNENDSNELYFKPKRTSGSESKKNKKETSFSVGRNFKVKMRKIKMQ